MRTSDLTADVSFVIDLTHKLVRDSVFADLCRVVFTSCRICAKCLA